VPQGPTGGWKPITVLEFLWIGVANNGFGGAWGAPCLVTLLCHARSMAWQHPVASPVHCGRLSTRLAGPDGAAYPHVLQAIIATTTLVRRMRLGKTRASLKNMRA
jgi:hypothetical protein